ncbi:unnamed protein product [Peronospora farinosa]|uniref:Uncharacterized protein n=1 Tax=Peronospora farinosa TaxID=134698 RepID=A0ABN8BZM2_9STRA|nr:unnamed protein product [Peronospora farinosa]
MGPERSRKEQAYSNLDVFSFQNVVLEWNLFKNMKEWQGESVDDNKMGSKASKLKGCNDETEGNDARFETLRSQVLIEEYATIYIAQVIDLAEEAIKKHNLKRQSKRDNADKSVDKETNTFDKELDALQNKIIECNEECGLLLFNVLQEFSLMKETNLALFSHEMYSRLISDTPANLPEGTLRIKLTTSDLPSVSALRLVCRHEEEKEADGGDGDDDESFDIVSTKEVDGPTQY